MEDKEEFYRTLCSLETLRSGKKGFFHDFSEQTIQTAGELWISKIFGRIKNDEDRIRTVFTDLKIKQVVIDTLSRVKTLFRDKDPNISRTRRLEGFQAASAAELEKALLLMSQAVLRAPATGKCKVIDQGFSLPLALLGRAEILIALKEYDLAMGDLTLAIEDDLPNNLRVDADQKRKACELLLRENHRSLIPVHQVQAGSLRGSKRKPKLSGGEHAELPGASNLIEIRETEAAGKHAVAAKEIQPGDVLVVEPPLAGCLLPEFFGTHCQHCFSRLRAPIGCPECSSVAFCGRECRDIAVSSYHKYECKILALLIGSGMSVLSSVALRMVTQEGPARCQKIYHALAERNSENKMGSDGDISTHMDKMSTGTETKLSRSAKRRMRKKKWRDSKCIQNEISDGEPEKKRDEEEVDIRAYDLVMHESRRSASDFFERSLMAAFLLKCLQRVNFFAKQTVNNDDGVLSDEENAVGVLLLKNLQLLQFNAHEFFETRLGKEHQFRGSKPVYLGVAIYPTVARFNHDCYPAVTRYFVGRDIVIRATRGLSPGEIVAENYGPIFTKRSLDERQRTLAGRYWFCCACRACQEDWPRFENLTNDAARLRCPTEGCEKLHRRPRDASRTIKCPTCQKKLDLRKALASLEDCEQLYAQGFAKMDEEKPREAIEIIIEAAKKFRRIAEPPHQDTHLAEIALSTCMADSGNTWKPMLL